MSLESSKTGPAADSPSAAPNPDIRVSQRPRRWGIQRRGYITPLLAISIVVCLLSLINIGADDAALRGKTFAPSLVAVIWLACYLFATYWTFRTAYLFASAYIVCLFIFHYGLLLQDGFGVITMAAWQGPLGAWAVRAGWYTNLALGCLGIGMSAYVLAHRAKAMPAAATVTRVAQHNSATLYDLGIGLLIASVVLLLGSIASYGNLLALTRLELFHFSDTRFISVFSMIVPSSSIALLVGARTKGQRRLSYAVSIFVVAFFLLSGQRSSVLFPMMAAAVLWVKMGRRINPLLAGVAVLGVLLVIPVVGYLRTLGAYGEIANAEAIEKASSYADVSVAFREMGGTIGPLIYTLMLIPEEEPYRYGVTYLRYALNVIPNIGLTADKSTSRAAVIEILQTQGERKALMAMNVGDWASYHIIPEQFVSGGGAGYSGVAEPYFNFGIVGVLVFFLGLGVFLGKLDCTPIILYRKWLVFGALIFWHLLPTVRNGLGMVTKAGVFILITVFIWLMVRRFLPINRLGGAVRARSAESVR